MKKSIILCADDFGMSSAIDDGIITLLKKGKLSAVSCMTNEACWEKDASLLIPFLDKAKIGLHFNLSYQSLGIFILKSYFGFLKTEKIKEALWSQYDRFVKIIGKKPDFIDGHQHIHQLPHVRDSLIEFYLSYYKNKDAFIRNTANKQNCLKAKLINCLGGKTLKKLLEKHNIPHNKNFSGVYGLTEKADYTALLKKFLVDIEGDGLIMCHPASEKAASPDLFRINEFNTLINTTFHAM